ncbi:MAG: hypothetical protein LBG94_01215 [Treponema sp.]|jgi:hypothetical protein|nr:hypothetical protein [Treponema sp.]
MKKIILILVSILLIMNGCPSTLSPDNVNNNNGITNESSNGIMHLIAYLSKDNNGTCYDLIITEYNNGISQNRVRSVTGNYSSYKLVVTPKGNKPVVSKGTAQRRNGGISLTPENQLSSTIDVTLNMDEISSIIIAPYDNTVTQPNGQLTPYHIYIAGNTGYTGIWDGNNETNGIKPCYWNGRQRVNLSVPSAPPNTLGTAGDAQKIIMKNDDVYVVGSYNFLPNYASLGCYWKNGVRIDLPESSGAFDIAITDNGDVYITGNPRNVYWKNGEKISFSSNLFAVEANGNDIYMLGEEIISNQGVIQQRNPSYWKNDVQNIIPENGKDIVVFGNKVYILFENSYWSSETNNKITLQSSHVVKTDYISVGENGDVFVIGMEGIAGSPSFIILNRAIWKNGQKLDLDIFNTTNTGGIIYDNIFTDALSSDGNLYVVGTTKGPNLSTPGYWINGERVDFYIPREYYPGNANSIWIVKNN